MIKSLSGAFFVVAFSATVAAEPCTDNFTSTGNFLTGTLYKTWAMLPDTQTQDAFARAYSFTTENGFSVLSADKSTGVISAAQSVSYGKGKTVPLNVSLQPEGNGTRIAISYATSGGLISPEDAIKRHFCLTIAAAADTSRHISAQTATSNETPSTAAPHSVSTPRGFAIATAGQQQAISHEMEKPLPNAQVQKLVNDARPAIESFLVRIACLNDSGGASALNEFAAPDVNLGNMYIMLRPMRTLQYHDKAACMSVARVQGWSSPANNALKFEALYKADDSGETGKLTHEAVRQPDGIWLFKQ